MTTWHPRLILWSLILAAPFAWWLLFSAVLRARLRPLYQRHFANPRRERLFLSAVSFLIAFAAARAVAYGVHRETLAFRGVFVNGTHVHHLVFGILLLLLTGYLWLLQFGTGLEQASSRARWWSRATAVLYGIGAALTLDEFALWFNLADVYWARAGRESLDAVILFLTVLSLSLWGGPFFQAVLRETAKLLRR